MRADSIFINAITDAACSEPTTVVFAFGHTAMKSGPIERPHIARFPAP